MRVWKVGEEKAEVADTITLQESKQNPRFNFFGEVIFTDVFGSEWKGG